MSAGLMELKSPSKGIPSRTYNGLLLAFIEPNPRMTTFDASPGCPPPEVIWIPGAVPSSALLKLATVRFSI